jgi:uncharacterized membrane protein YfcA/uncharacterized membrane protein
MESHGEPVVSPAHARVRELPRSEMWLSVVLRGGVLVSSLIIGIGVVWFYALQLAGYPVPFSFPHTLAAVFQDLARGQPLAVIALGLLVLLATPVARVAVSIVLFAEEHDSLYVVINVLVLVILLFSILVLGAVLGRGAESYSFRGDLAFFALVLIGSVFAGYVGALVGLGGGVFVVPLLTLVFHVPIQEAIGASIVSVIATSSGSAAAYVRDKIINLRVGMFLGIATTLGAITGALLATVLHSRILFLIFGIVLLSSVAPLVVRMGQELPEDVHPDRWSRRLRLASSYPDQKLGKVVAYEVTGVPVGFGMMYVAGGLSGLLGIGSGSFKVLAMDTAMRLPMKVSTTTSNFMIGVTAAASAGIYFQRGLMDPIMAAPVALGVLLGATLGAVTLPRLSNVRIRTIFVPLVVLVALEMLLRGLGVTL